MIQVPISAGELYDKLSILHIKSTRVTDDKKLTDILKEKLLLAEITSEIIIGNVSVLNQYLRLIEVNTKLWEIEDKIREKEKLKEFDEDFIFLARQVYLNNDLRFEYKSQINILLNSEIVEVKQYK